MARAGAVRQTRRSKGSEKSLQTERPRLTRNRNFPAYAYLPGRQPHPVRDPAGHSYGIPAGAAVASLEAEELLWGHDLFNHGYYWEAHEAWEGLWQSADKGSPLRNLLKGLILIAAAGVKIREGKSAPAVRHAGRAAGLFRQLMLAPEGSHGQALGMSPATLADQVLSTASAPPCLTATAPGRPHVVFPFILGDFSCHTPPLANAAEDSPVILPGTGS
ncbi:DUF309 domain-containing protein [Pseudorhizobium marinum]|uniref:DUF309 domain-containing protein n=1 Tax=Pseudorhizobium marinum TaxID=1496690 RepID=UPI001F17012B|nr:DUF309 domain-containing protein [Pseudorhizobium marinum]